MEPGEIYEFISEAGTSRLTFGESQKLETAWATMELCHQEGFCSGCKAAFSILKAAIAGSRAAVISKSDDPGATLNPMLLGFTMTSGSRSSSHCSNSALDRTTGILSVDSLGSCALISQLSDL